MLSKKLTLFDRTLKTSLRQFVSQRTGKGKRTTKGKKSCPRNDVMAEEKRQQKLGEFATGKTICLNAFEECRDQPIRFWYHNVKFPREDLLLIVSETQISRTDRCSHISSSFTSALHVLIHIKYITRNCPEFPASLASLINVYQLIRKASLFNQARN